MIRISWRCVGPAVKTLDDRPLAHQHLRVLENAGLVARRVEGRVHHISLNPEPLRTASEWLEIYRAFWEMRLDALEQFLARKKGAAHGAGRPTHPKDRRHPR